ncbi:MAG: 4-alpha-glucanotransferase [Chloroflexota bacterium]
MIVAEASSPSSALRKLANLYGVELSYVDAAHERRFASSEGVLAALKALGAPITAEGDVANAVVERQRELWLQMIEPVAVAWDGVAPAIEVRLPVSAKGTLHIEMMLETGETTRWNADISRLRVTDRAEIAGDYYVARTLVLKPKRLPEAYHRLSVRLGRRTAEALVISAPTKCYAGEGEPAWGVFLPLYALQSERSWGSGDFSDLASLAAWTAELGGETVSTLPLFAQFLDQPFVPSPYSPASRLFWNEFYLDVSASPDLASSREAQRIVASAAFRRDVETLRREKTVDYKKGMALKRRVLEPLAKACFDSPERMKALRKFVRERPAVEDYARFRAVVERRRESWQSWPERLRDGQISDRDYDDASRRYHLYVQFLAHEQLAALQKNADADGVRLYFDLPLGVHSDGYDVWRERDEFAMQMNGGAPPDTFFTLGQDWGFPPMHPENMRRSGYRYYRAIVGNLLRYGRVLRMDHVMGLHHLYCVPRGMDARHGVYVRFPADEMYAILSLESHRHKAIIVGEDLGTVPPYVHTAMTRHAVHRTYVVQYEAAPGWEDPLPEPRPLSVAAMNTHDMPPFAAYWQSLDTEDRLDLGLLSGEQASAERERMAKTRAAVVRELRRRKLLGRKVPTLEEVLRAALLALGETKAHVVLTNLEDLWCETLPQNVPGTTEERVNWRRKARYTLEEMKTLPQVTDTLRALDLARGRRVASKRK